ncbi:MAG: hypothetical protein QM708_14740 [Propioniciclava sp.]
MAASTICAPARRAASPRAIIRSASSMSIDQARAAPGPSPLTS